MKAILRPFWMLCKQIAFQAFAIGGEKTAGEQGEFRRGFVSAELDHDVVHDFWLLGELLSAVLHREDYTASMVAGSMFCFWHQAA